MATFIYRGIPAQFVNEDFVPSALRNHEKGYMAQNLRDEKWLNAEEQSVFKRNLNMIEEQVNTPLKHWKNVKAEDIRLFYASLCLMGLYITNRKSYEEKKEIVPYLLGQGSKIDILNTYFDTIIGIIIGKGSMFDQIKKLPNDKFPNKYAQMLQSMVASNLNIYSKYQHSNFWGGNSGMTADPPPNIPKSGLGYNIYPTALLDWTYSEIIAQNFADKGGIVCRIDLEKHQDFVRASDSNKLFMSEKAEEQNGQEQLLYGVDYKSLISDGNQNIQNQEGVLLLWLWRYKIAELEYNKLGRALGFKVIDWGDAIQVVCRDP